VIGISPRSTRSLENAPPVPPSPKSAATPDGAEWVNSWERLARATNARDAAGKKREPAASASAPCAAAGATAAGFRTFE